MHPKHNGHRNGSPQNRGPRLYIGNLPYQMTPDDLVTVFADAGFAVIRPHIVVDKETGNSKGFGFVEMKDGDVEEAIRVMDGSQVGGRTVRVDRAHERQS